MIIFHIAGLLVCSILMAAMIVEFGRWLGTRLAERTGDLQ